MADPSKPATGYPAAQPSYYPQGPGPAHFYGPYAQGPYPPYQAPPAQPYRGRYFFRRILALIISLAVLAGIAILIAWLVLRPHRPKFYVDDGVLSQFNVTGGQLTARMDFNITARNPNKKIGIYYDRIDATAFYQPDGHGYGRQRIGWTSLRTFYQGHKNTTTLLPRFIADGEYVDGGISNDGSAGSRGSGSLDLTVRLYALIRFKVGRWITRHYYMDVECRVRLPLNGTPYGRLYGRRRCDVDI